MANFLRNLSIRRKLTVIIMVICLVALLLAATALAIYDQLSFRQKMAERMLILADMIAMSCAQAVVSNDQHVSAEILTQLRADQRICSACIFKSGGGAFACYNRPGEFLPVPTPKPFGSYFEKDRLYAFRPIRYNGQMVGTLYVQTDLTELRLRLVNLAKIVAVVLLVAMLLALALSAALQGPISRPLLHLAEMERRVTAEKNYSLRAVSENKDELGLLIEGFNNMLAAIQTRDRQLTVSREYADSVIRSMGDGLVVVDREGIIKTVNRTLLDMLGYTEEELLGKPMGMLEPEQGMFVGTTIRKAIVTKLISDGSVRDFELTYLRKDGQTIPVNCSGSVMSDADSRLLGLVIIAKDITERKRQEEALKEAKTAAEEANTAKSKFLASMSHELRTPLNAIIGYSEMLQEEVEDLDQQDLIPDLKKIHGAGRHLLALINDVLDLSKIEAGKMEVYPENFNVGELVREVETTVQPLIEKNQNKLEVCCDETLGQMYSDVTKVRQLMFNLLSNAAKFTTEGEIFLQVVKTPLEALEGVRFQVKDSGIGMTPDQMARLFQPFQQAESSTSRKFGGTGLGLALCRRFAEMLGGSISVQSEYGKGSTFIVDLPIEYCAAEAGKKPQPGKSTG